LTAFGVDSNGISPYGDLVQGADGAFYGTTSSLGTGLKGTVFRLAPARAALGASLQTNVLRIDWSAWPGLSYQVQYQTNPAQTDWLDFGPVLLATNGLTWVSDPIVSQPRYYRLKQISAP
jgi:hypothetical protein